MTDQKYIEHLNDIGLKTSRPKLPCEGDIYVDIDTEKTWLYTNCWREIEAATTTIKHFEDTADAWRAANGNIPRFVQVADEL